VGTPDKGPELKYTRKLYSDDFLSADSTLDPDILEKMNALIYNSIQNEEKWMTHDALTESEDGYVYTKTENSVDDNLRLEYYKLLDDMES
jgi:hypothetical protein